MHVHILTCAHTKTILKYVWTNSDHLITATRVIH